MTGHFGTQPLLQETKSSARKEKAGSKVPLILVCIAIGHGLFFQLVVLPVLAGSAWYTKIAVAIAVALSCAWLCLWTEDRVKRAPKVEQPIIAVIGCGPNGLAVAAGALERGYRVAMFDKQAGIGGDWLKFGNEKSKLQSHIAGVLIDTTIEPSELGMPTYPSREQMLIYYNTWAERKGITPNIRFNATVLDVKDVEGGGHTVVYEQGGVQKTFRCTHVYSAPGKQGTVNAITLPGEEKFAGKVAWGVSGDIDNFDFEGKRVTIIGSGSFAIENARTACEKGASSVTILCRGNQFVMPRCVEALLERHYHVLTPVATASLVDASMSMYRLVPDDPLARREAIDEWLNHGQSSTLVPTSDVYFLLRAIGKLRVVLGSARDCRKDAVVTCSGEAIPTDILIKSMGFSRNVAFDRVVAGGGDRRCLSDDDFYAQYGHKFADGTSKFICWQRFFPYPAQFHGYSSPEWPRPNVPLPTSGYCLPFFHAVEGQSHQSVLGQLRYLLRVSAFYVKHMRAVAGLQSDEALVEEQAAEWAGYCRRWGAEVPYPYTTQDLRDMGRAFAASGSFRGRLLKRLSALQPLDAAASGRERPRAECDRCQNLPEQRAHVKDMDSASSVPQTATGA